MISLARSLKVAPKLLNGDCITNDSGESVMETLSIAITPHRSKHNELLSTCNRIAGETLKLNGCIDCRVSSDGAAEASAIRMEQNWRQRNLLEDYLRSDHFSALLGAMKLLSTHSEVVINNSSPAQGALFLDSARSKQ